MTFVLFGANLILFLILANLFDLNFARLSWIAMLHFLFLKLLFQLSGRKSLLAFPAIAFQFCGLVIAATYLANNRQTEFFLAIVATTFITAAVLAQTADRRLTSVIMSDCLILAGTLEFASAHDSQLVYSFKTSLIIPTGTGLLLAIIFFVAKHWISTRNQFNLAAKKSRP
jgi:hypothetical protein